MIVSHERRFIFIKTRKVAGSSVEAYLRRFCGPDDLISPLIAGEEEIARAHGAMRPSARTDRHAFPWEMNRKRIGQLRRDRSWPRINTVFNHQSAEGIRKLVGERDWNSYYRISMTRNPWDRAISSYFWHKSQAVGYEVTVDTVIEMQGQNWRTMSIDGELAVHEVIRYECLLDDMRSVCERIGIPEPTELPRFKSGVRPPRTEPRRFFTERQIERIAEVCHHEIALFGYELQ